MVTLNTPVYIKFIGDGSADIGPMDASEVFPTLGVIPNLVFTLCGRPDSMRVRRVKPAFHQSKGGRQKKILLARLRARYENDCAGIIYDVDTEGDDVKTLLRDMSASRDSGDRSAPMVIGVAHPCLEVWLMADAAPIKKVFGLDSSPQVPAKPEELPAPCHDRKRNPKTELVRCAGVQQRSDLSVEQKTQIARAIHVLDRIKERCPLSFAPFTAEVEQYIKPLFA